MRKGIVAAEGRTPQLMSLGRCGRQNVVLPQRPCPSPRAHSPASSCWLKFFFPLLFCYISVSMRMGDYMYA